MGKFLPEKLKELFEKGDRRFRILFIFGIIGIVLIGISQLWSGEKSGEIPVINEEYLTNEYRTKLEKDITEMISAVGGVGSVKVMITLEGGAEYIYEKEEDISYDRNEDRGESDAAKVHQREDREETYVFVEDTNGRKTALVRKRLEPEIRGVVVVCDGGKNVSVVKSVCDLVTTSLNIGYDRVCVIQSNQS